MIGGGAAGLNVVAIDPGTLGGFALLDHERRLRACGTLELRYLREAARTIDDLIRDLMHGGPVVLLVESQTIYPGGKQKAKPADVIRLAQEAGEIAGFLRCYLTDRYGGTAWVAPRTWKGQMPKDAVRHHVGRILDKVEAETADLGVLSDDVVEAVGIGLWAVGRWGRGTT